MVGSLPQIHEIVGVCEGCALGKHHRKPFSKGVAWRAKEILELVHTDLCGSMRNPSHGNNLYIILFIDDFSRMTWVYFMKEKSQVFEIFKKFKNFVEKQTGSFIKILRSDQGKEYNSKELDKFCEDKGMHKQLTSRYTPQQNGVFERKNQTIVEIAKSMMHEKGLPKSFWVEAVYTAVYLLNRSPTKALDNKTPLEAWNGRKPLYLAKKLLKNLQVHRQESFEEAIREESWKKAMKDEIQVIEKNNTWDVTPPFLHIAAEANLGLYKFPWENGDWMAIDRLHELVDFAFDGNSGLLYGSSQTDLQTKTLLVSNGSTKSSKMQMVRSKKQGETSHKRLLTTARNYYDETFAPVARMDTVRAIISLAGQKGWLKQAPRAWYSQMDGYFEEKGFDQSKIEPTLYVKNQGTSDILIVALYVDDLVFTGNTKKMIEDFKNEMMQK
ncbi:retrovirus-related pol polyprotein from transposon RE1 [Tanacetum coccineum]